MKRSQSGDYFALERDLKKRIVREAANLLYFGVEKEFKQAKQQAAKTAGSHFLPSNFEVAIELDKLSEEHEGVKREDRLIEMRKDALKVMKLLSPFCPVLIGSVWRGTIRQGSDIDISVFTDEPNEISTALKGGSIKVIKEIWVRVNKYGTTVESFHIYAQTHLNYNLEIVVRSRDEGKKKRRCETFGDEIKGLTIKELEKTLLKNPTQKYIPL